MGRENRFITVVNLMNKDLKKFDHIEYDIENKEFVFGSISDYFVAYADDLSEYDFSWEQEKNIRKAYSLGLSATGAQYYVNDDEPTKLYYSSADKDSIPRVIFDANRPDNIDKSFIDDEIEEPVIIPMLS